MTSAWLSVLLVLLVLAGLPWAIKRLQAKAWSGAAGGAGAGARIVSAVGVGPQQRVVTVEVGPPQARTWLTLGVTPQSITCLHTQAAPVPAAAEVLAAPQSGA